MQSRNIIMFISLFILKQLYSNVLFCLFCYEVSWKWLSIFIIFNFYQKHYDHCHIQKVFLSKNKDIFGNENPKTTSLQWFKFGIYLSIFIRLIDSAKILEHLTIQLLWATAGLLVTHFIVQSTQWMKERKTWGWSEISSYYFFVWREFKFIAPACKGSISIVLFQLKLQSSGGVSHHPIVWAMTWLLVTHNLIYPVDECPFKEMKKWGQYEILFYCFVFGAN